MARKEEPSAVLREIERQYGILPMPSLETLINLSGDHQEIFPLRTVLKFTPEQILRHSLDVFRVAEKKARGSQKPLASARMKNWLSIGVGRTLAALAQNPGLPFKWTFDGPVGDLGWRRPSAQEAEYWNWVYNLSGRHPQGHLILREIPHAAFVMRAMVRDGVEVGDRKLSNKDLERFLSQIDGLMGVEEENPDVLGMRVVSAHFSRPAEAGYRPRRPVSSF